MGDPPDVLIEAFGCEPAPELVARCAQRASAGGPKCMWINLEYLSAEPQVERLHGLPSPVSQGPGAGLAKHFFCPGFTAATGGLLREPDLMQTQARFERAAWLAAQGIEWRGERLVALFCYEPPALAALLARLQAAPEPTHLLVAAGRPTEAVKAIFSKEKGLKPILDVRSQLSISYLPLMLQTEFDRLLWACELNFVRGEDSLVRALWAGAPFIWQLYPQSDNAHHAKLEAFLDWLAAPPSMRLFHRVWNGVEGAALPALANADLAEWRACVQAARERLLAQDDLMTRLARFVWQKS